MLVSVLTFYIKKNNPNLNVVLIEKSDSVGGLLRSFQYPEHGVFDMGIHTLYETGNREIDDIILSALPKEE